MNEEPLTAITLEEDVEPPGFLPLEEAVESEGEEEIVALPVLSLVAPSTPMLQPIEAEQPKKPRRTCRQFMRKYFCAGQIKEDFDEGPAPPGSSWFYAHFVHHRPQAVTVVVPFLLVVVPWIIVFSYFDLWWCFAHQGGVPGWTAALIMLFGSFVAGATSEGGGSIAYPTFTLILGIPSSVARDFSLGIQSIGMVAGSFTILYGRIMVEWDALIFGAIAGAAGIIFSLLVVAPALPDDYSKMIFVSCFLAFAINLFVLNMQKKRVTYLRLPNVTWQKRLALLVTGFVGGILSGIAGSGIDICMFSVLTLVFRLSEKTATPTSVVLMATNTVVGFIFQWARGAIVRDTFVALACAWLVVPIGAPVGAFVSSFLHRQVLACFVYFTDLTQFIMALAITQLDLPLGLTMAGTLLGAILLFSAFRALGTYQLKQDLRLLKNKVSLVTHVNVPHYPGGMVREDEAIIMIDDDWDLKHIEMEFESSEMVYERRRWKSRPRITTVPLEVSLDATASTEMMSNSDLAGSELADFGLRDSGLDPV